MFNNIKVSVVVPVYQVEKYLENCLISLVSQDFKERYQIILIDLGSSDSSSSICQRYEALYPELFYRFHSFENRGVSVSRNIGLSILNSEYATFVDADDTVSSDYLSFMYEAMKKDDLDIFSVGTIEEDGKKSGVDFFSTGRVALLKLYKKLANKINTCCWGRMYKTSLIKESLIRFPVDLSYFEDMVFFCHSLYKARRVKFSSKPLYFYRNRSDSAMHQKVDLVSSYLIALERVRELIEKEDIFYISKLYSRPFKAIKNKLKQYSQLTGEILNKDPELLYKESKKELDKIFQRR